MLVWRVRCLVISVSLHRKLYGVQTPNINANAFLISAEYIQCMCAERKREREHHKNAMDKLLGTLRYSGVAVYNVLVCRCIRYTLRCSISEQLNLF